jgi:hypothetical protein
VSAGQSAYPEKTPQLFQYHDVMACRQDNRDIRKKRRISLNINTLQRVGRIIEIDRCNRKFRIGRPRVALCQLV